MFAAGFPGATIPAQDQVGIFAASGFLTAESGFMRRSLGWRGRC